MTLLALFFQIFLLLSCFTGVGLTSYWLCPRIPFSFQFCFTPFFLILGLFCLEHYLPLGQLPFLWIPMIAWTFGLLRFRPYLFRQLGDPVIVYFLIGFCICFIWRFLYPDIWETSEQLPDLDHLVTWYQGEKLPALDRFCVGEPDTSYYVLQYYAGGLVHRFMGTGPGLTYHLAYSLLIGVGIAAFGAGVRAATRSSFAGYCAAIWIVLGGGGTTTVVPFMVDTYRPEPRDGMRFLGSYAVDGMSGMTDFGKHFIHITGISKVDAPMEYYSYIIWLGDFHPSLCSMVFLGLGFLAIGTAEQALPNSLADKACLAGGLATAMVMVITNTWITPLQICLMAVWIGYRYLIGRRDSLFLLAGCVLVPLVLIFPFFNRFAHDSSHYPMQFQLVPWHMYKERPETTLPSFLNTPALNWIPKIIDHLYPEGDSPELVPPLAWLTVMYPAFFTWLLALVPLIFSRGNVRYFALFTFMLGAAMPGTYFIYLHDVYGAQEGIFNACLKWWPWVYAVVTMTSFITVWNYCAKRSNKALIILCAMILVPTVVFNTYILVANVYQQFGVGWEGAGTHSHVGHMDGNAWAIENSYDAITSQYLSALPPGTVLESKVPEGNDTAASIGLFNGKSQVGAWLGHEQLWRGDREDLAIIAIDRDLFYSGALPTASSWLRCVVPGGVDYIAWLDRDNADLTAWKKINDQIKDDYDWRPSFEYGDGHWGLWIRKTTTSQPKS